MRLHALALGAALVIAAPGAAAAGCLRPTAPTAIDGASATTEQLLAYKASVTSFLSASDAYQQCVIDDTAAQKEAAKKARTKLDASVFKAADQAIKANQQDKEQAGKAFNGAVKAYKAAHPS